MSQPGSLGFGPDNLNNVAYTDDDARVVRRIPAWVAAAVAEIGEIMPTVFMFRLAIMSVFSF